MTSERIGADGGGPPSVPPPSRGQALPGHPLPSLGQAPPQSAESDSPEPVGSAIHEAMLEAIGDLSEEERARLIAIDQPEETVEAWRDLIAERAAQERELSLRREFQAESLAAQPQPTRGLQGAAAPSPAPSSVTEWTDWIRGSDEPSQQLRRRAEFANWLLAHPEA